MERRVSIFDIELPRRLSEKKYVQYLSLLKYELVDKRRRWIQDTTPTGSFCYGNANSSATKDLRLEVDSRFITDEQVMNIITQILIEIKYLKP